MRQYAPTHETRERILDAAERLYGEYGLSKTTMGDVAKACGYTASNVHRLFKTKSALSEAIVARFLGRIEGAVVQALASAQSPGGKMRALLETLAAETAARFKDDGKVSQMVVQGLEEDWLTVRTYKARIRFFIKEILDAYAPPALLGKTSDETVEIIYACAVRLFHPLVASEFRRREEKNAASPLIEFLVGALDAASRGAAAPDRP